MVTSLIFSLAIGQIMPDRKSLFETLFPKPTGANGYEEVARAADLSRRLNISLYQSWLPPEKRPQELPPVHKSKEIEEFEKALEDKPDPKLVALKQRLNAMTLLAVRAEEVQVGAPIIQLIKAALLKPMSRPYEDGDMIPMDEMQSLRNGGTLFADSAYVHFAQGRPTAGYESLATGLRYADRVSPFGIMNLLAASAISSRLLGGFEQHLERIPLAELQQIPVLTQSLLKLNRLSETHAYEEHLDVARVGEMAKEMLAPNASNGEESDDETMRALGRQIKNMTAAQKASFATELKRRVRARYAEFQEQLRRAESEWIPAEESSSDVEPKVSSLNDVIDLLVQWTLPAKRTVAITHVRYRAQIRLLELHSRVQAFRWTHGRLPLQLAELGLSKAALHDHLSRVPFVYELQSDKEYRLYSKGTAETGEVFLKYTRPKQTPDNEDP